MWFLLIIKKAFIKTLEIEIYFLVVFWCEVFGVELLNCFCKIVDNVRQIFCIYNINIIIYSVIMRGFVHINC